MPKASQDYNLYMLKPNLIMEWHPSKNGNLRPRDVTPGSGKKAWWLCGEGHEWQAAIYSRSRGSGCPQCYKGNSIINEDIAVSKSTFVREWHPTKNVYLDPRDVSPFSGEKAWWLCKEGHEWQATVKSRMKGTGCPHCGGVIEESKFPANKTKITSPSTPGEDDRKSTQKKSLIGPAIVDTKFGTDFRKDTRFEFRDTIMLENQNSGEWSYARSANISGVGLFFESEIPFKLHTRIIIEFNNPPFKSVQKTYPSVVRWCKELPYDSTASFYGVGVQFI